MIVSQPWSHMSLASVGAHTGGGLCINSMNFSPPPPAWTVSDRNVGYIADFWAKLDKWDPTLERKAGGVVPKENVDLGHATFYISNSSSVMALVRAVVGHVMRTNTVPEPLSTYFKSLKIMWLFSAQVLMQCR